MADQWYYLVNGLQQGPMDEAAVAAMARSGALRPDTLVWKQGLAGWVQAASVPTFFASPPQVPAAGGPPPLPPAGYVPVTQGPSGRGMLGDIGAKISEVSALPTITGMPIKEILMGGLQRKTRTEDIEDLFAVGTQSTTPQLVDVKPEWPIPRVFWRIMGGALGVYILMRFGWDQFHNSNLIPGLIVVGSFVVPFSVVILLFEMNTPRNVSVYSVGKMVFLGGALSLVVTLFLFTFIPGSGVGAWGPALLTGVIEETGKALALLLIVRSARYPYQLNGLLFGAAVGAGFAGFESAGYAFNAGMAGSGSAEAVFQSILLRGILSPGGHVIWTAMVGSAIWRVKGSRPFEVGMLFHPEVIRRWVIASVLHGIWDADVYIHTYAKLAILIVLGWYLIFAILKQGQEEVDQAHRVSLASLTAQPAQPRIQ